VRPVGGCGRVLRYGMVEDSHAERRGIGREDACGHDGGGGPWTVLVPPVAGGAAGCVAVAPSPAGSWSDGDPRTALELSTASS
jgi:hypothetical protein